MNERLRELRAALKLSQKEFSQKISVGYSTLAQFETGARQIKDIHIARICDVFGVNERWFRTGDGDMFLPNNNTLIEQVVKEYGLDTSGRALLQTLLELPDGYASVLLDAARRLVAKADVIESKISIDAEVESYRCELESEAKAAEESSASPATAAREA